MDLLGEVETGAVARNLPPCTEATEMDSSPHAMEQVAPVSRLKADKLLIILGIRSGTPWLVL